VDDTQFFGPDLNAIKKIITELEVLGYGWTCKEGEETTAFVFLGVRILQIPSLEVEIDPNRPHPQCPFCHRNAGL
jgi:hypothetical protein